MEDNFVSPERKGGARQRRVGDSIRSALVYSGLILAVSLAAKLATTHHATNSDLALRFVMAITGAFLVLTGNAIPKTLTPLSAERCDPIRVQTFRRFAGWTWVLAGLMLAIGWLVLPVARAERMTFTLLPTAILVIVALFIRLIWKRQKNNVMQE